MSVIYITDHDEVIYNAIKSREIIRKKSPRYKSYIDNSAFIDEGKRPYGTMGPPEVELPNPANFLKKNSRNVIANPKPCVGPQCLKKELLSSIPKAEKIKKPPEQNFIKKNMINAMKAKPPNIEPKFIDTRTGTSHRVENSGLEPRHIHSKKFGKPPYYLLTRVETEKKISQVSKDREELKTLSKCRYITRQERQGLLNGLKQNWEEMQKQYQLLPIITDTIPKILRKTKMENDLKLLEKDITLVEKHPYIYVYDEE